MGKVMQLGWQSRGRQGIRRELKKQATRWMRRLWKQLGENAPKKHRYWKWD